MDWILRKTRNHVLRNTVMTVQEMETYLLSTYRVAGHSGSRLFNKAVESAILSPYPVETYRFNMIVVDSFFAAYAAKRMREFSETG